MSNEKTVSLPVVQTESQREKHEAFMAHLKRAAAEVASWPAWKQQILGGVGPRPMPPPATSA